jgi:methionyl aminopeptidase
LAVTKVVRVCFKDMYHFSAYSTTTQDLFTKSNDNQFDYQDRRNRRRSRIANLEQLQRLKAFVGRNSNKRLKKMADSAKLDPEVDSHDEEEEEGTDVPIGTAQAATTTPANGAPAKKKKTKKKKKKAEVASSTEAAKGGSALSAAARTSPTEKFNHVSTLPEEEFLKYCKTILANTAPKDLPPVEKLLEIPKKFENYRFTGSLRPTFVTKRIQCPDSIAKPDYAVTGISLSEQEDDRKAQIHVYSPQEIAKVRKACMIGREVLDIAGRYARAGVTGDELNRIVHEACIERNAYPSPLNYYDFPKSVCVSVNEIICHGIPDFRPLENGDIVNIDVSVYVDGVHADLNETFLIGECDEESKKLVKTAYLALAEACKQIKPGTFYRDVGQEISRIAGKNGCAVVKKYCGHGVGRLFHCMPSIPHYAHNKAVGIMRPGHIFTIEPMLNLGTNWGDVLWPDNWTAATKDGKRSAQFEHTFLVTETGCEILTARPGTSKSEMIWDDELEQRLTRPGTPYPTTEVATGIPPIVPTPTATTQPTSAATEGSETVKE